MPRAERILRASLEQADRAVTLRTARGRAEARAILRMLNRADDELRKRLRREGLRFGLEERFTGAGYLAYLRQIDIVRSFVQDRLGRLSRRASLLNVQEGWKRTADLLRRLEGANAGVVRTLRIDSARMMNEETRGIRASLLLQNEQSMQRYGRRLERKIRKELQTTLLSGGSFTDAVDKLVAASGPRGVFHGSRYAAMRIVRTETAYAQNAAAQEALQRSQREDFPDLKRKILAVMDSRTAADSRAVHGQIRGIYEPFMDGAGRIYMHPPARPNDREIVVPWRPSWGETSTSRPRRSV